MKRPFTFGDVCSGIGVAEIAAEPLGWKNAFVAEIEPAPCYVLHHRRGASRPKYMPDPGEEGITPKEKRSRRAAIRRVSTLPAEPIQGPQNFGDFTQIHEGEHDPIDLLIGGTPCQDFSIAGKRAGLDGDRGNLTLEFGRLARRSRTRWIVWENVPGVFSNNDGRDFAEVLGMFTGRHISVPDGGWQNSGAVEGLPNAFGVAWVVRDAQYVRVDGFPRAVPQRRRRVIVVGYIGDWRRAAAVLFDTESLRGDSPPRRGAGQNPPEDFDASSGIRRIPPEVSHALDASRGGDSGKSQQRSYVPEIMRQALTSKIAKGSSGPTGDEHHHLVAHSLRADGYDASEDGSGRGTPIVPVLDRDTAPTLDANYGRLHGASHNDANHGHGHLIPEVSAPLGAGDGHRGFRNDLDQGVFLPVAFMPARTLADDGGVDFRFAERDVADAVHTGTGSGNKAPVIAFGHTDADPTMRMDVAPTLRSMQHDQSHANGGSSIAVAIQERAISMSEGTTSGPDGTGVRDDGSSFTLENRHTVQAVAFESRVARNGRGAPEEVSQPLKAQSGTSGKGDAAPLIAANAGDPAWQVRRLMPIECERLQGVPDNFTLVPFGNRLMADGPRYKMLGNAYPGNMIRWVFTRIDMVEQLIEEKRI